MPITIHGPDSEDESLLEEGSEILMYWATSREGLKHDNGDKSPSSWVWGALCAAACGCGRSEHEGEEDLGMGVANENEE